MRSAPPRLALRQPMEYAAPLLLGAGALVAVYAAFFRRSAWLLVAAGT